MLVQAPCGKQVSTKEFYRHASSCTECIKIDAARLDRIRGKKKGPEMEKLRVDSIKADVCVTCGGHAIEFNDVRSYREYIISGMCQVCQDETFRKEKSE